MCGRAGRLIVWSAEQRAKGKGKRAEGEGGRWHRMSCEHTSCIYRKSSLAPGGPPASLPRPAESRVQPTSEPTPHGVAGRDYLTFCPRPPSPNAIPWADVTFCHMESWPWAQLAGSPPLEVVSGVARRTEPAATANHSRRSVDRNAAASCKARPCTVVWTHSRGGERRWCYRPRVADKDRRTAATVVAWGLPLSLSL